MVEDHLHSQPDLTLAHLAVLYERPALVAQEHELELVKIACLRPIIVERGLNSEREAFKAKTELSHSLQQVC